MANNNQNNNNQPKPNNTNLSKPKQKIGNFYDFRKISQQKLANVQIRTNKYAIRHFITGIIFGFLTEYLLGNTKIYDNAVNRATMRRLNAKKKQDAKIGLIKIKRNHQQNNKHI